MCASATLLSLDKILGLKKERLFKILYLFLEFIFSLYDLLRYSMIFQEF